MKTIYQVVAGKNWEKISTKDFLVNRTSYTPGFTGKATLYRYVGTLHEEFKLKPPSYGAVFQIKVATSFDPSVGVGLNPGPASIIAGSSGSISDAIKKVFGIKNRLGAAAHSYKDWGDPIGLNGSGDGANQDWKKGKGTLIYT
jgi:hypothetical protein